MALPQLGRIVGDSTRRPPNRVPSANRARPPPESRSHREQRSWQRFHGEICPIPVKASPHRSEDVPVLTLIRLDEFPLAGGIERAGKFDGGKGLDEFPAPFGRQAANVIQLAVTWPTTASLPPRVGACSDMAPCPARVLLTMVLACLVISELGRSRWRVERQKLRQGTTAGGRSPAQFHPRDSALLRGLKAATVSGLVNHRKRLCWPTTRGK